MGYADKYWMYLQEVPVIIERCRATGRRPALGYTSNLDVLIDWDEEEFNRLLEEYLVNPPSFVKDEVISSMKDLVRIVSYFAINGLGGEIEVTNSEVAAEIMERFMFRYGLGGTCAQGAAALGALGVPALIHITDASKEVLKRLDYNGVETVCSGSRIPVVKSDYSGEASLHLIVQYPKGGKLQIGDKYIDIPLSNRVIIDYDQLHKTLPVDKSFVEHLEEYAENICSYNISGFNAILDLNVLKERLRELCGHYKRLKKRNPKVIIYLESAHYMSSDIRDYLYNTLAEHIDVMGMNEEELVDFADQLEFKVDKNDIHSVIHNLDFMLERFPAKGVVLHTKDYSLYYGRSLNAVNIELGLTMGNLLSGTRARTGKYGNLDDCRETLKLELSEVGLRFYEELQIAQPKHHAVLVPSRYMEHPKYTIGLGDTFVAGLQLGLVDDIFFDPS